MALLGEEKTEVIEEPEVEETTSSPEEEIVVEDDSVKKIDKKSSSKKSKNSNAVKGTISELKKVTWPTFGRVCKETVVVLSVVAVFLVAITGIDWLLHLLYKLLTKSM